MLHLVAVEEDEALQEIYCEFASTGLAGSADDYIMRGVEVFYTYEEKNGKKELDKVYFMNSAHKVIETSAANYTYVEGKDSGDYYYYTRGTKKDTYSDYEKLEGYLTVNNEKIYFFDAPYTYLEPTFTPDMDDDTRYELKNEKNVKLINIKCLDMEKGTYSYYVDSTKPVGTPEDMMANLVRIFSRGVYKLKFFDVDGDGIYEYAHYMPATYGFMDGDDGKYFSTAMDDNKPVQKAQKGSELDMSFVPTIYYNDAKISGAKFEDGDMVLAYLNPAANMIEVMNVIKPYNGYINQVRTEHGMVRIDSTTFQSAYTWRIVEEFDDDSSLYETYHLISNSSHDFFTLPSFSSGNTFPNLMSQKAVGEVFDIYAMKTNGWNPVIFWYDHVDDASVSFALDELAIPVSDENKAETYTKSKFDAQKGDTLQYVQVYFDGKVSWLPIDEEEMYPELDPGYEGDVYNLSEVKGQDGYMAYVDKICKVKKNTDGTYTLIPLLHAEDDEDNYVGVNRDSTTLVEEDNNKQYGNDLDMEVEGYIKKIAGSRYELVDESGETLLGDPFDVNGETVNYFNMTAATRIIIKNTVSGGEDEVEFLEFDAASFGGTVTTPLTNIQYILKGDPNSATKADLVLLYAEAEDFEFDVKGIKNGWRIVADSAVAADSEGDYRNYYTLFNPYTGEVEEKVPGNEYDEKASNLPEAVEPGTVAEIKNSMVKEDGDYLGVIDTSVSTGLVYITEYDETDSYIGFVPVEAIENAIDDGTISSGDDLADFVEGFQYYGDEYNFDEEEFKTSVDSYGDPIYGSALYYEITEDTVISVLTSKKAGVEAFEKGEFKLADISAIAGAGKEFRCYNEKVLNRKEVYGTEYAEYVKAYVYASEDAEDEDELPVAEYIIIVVNGGEELIFTDHDDNFLPDSSL